MRPLLRNARGSFLILTSWLLALLALLALGVSFRGHLAVRMAAYALDVLHAQQAAHAGLARALEVLADDTNPFDALNESWAANEAAFRDQVVWAERTRCDVAYEVPSTSGAAQTVYGVQDEQSRLHLNTASADMLARLPLMDADVAQAIVAFRDAAAQPAEDAHYQRLTPPYRTKRAPFDTLAELRLVRGMTPARFQIVLRYGTVYPTEGAPVNLNTASDIVLVALGLSPRLVEDLLRHRAGADGLTGTSDDGVWVQPTIDPDEWPGMNADDAAALGALLAGGMLDVRSAASRIRVTGRTTDGSVRTTLETVVPRGSRQPLAWQVE